MKLVYFAWLRERIGRGEEDVTPPPGVVDGAGLIAWLAGRGEEYAHAFQFPDAVRVAYDQELADQNEPFGEAREVAFFPPMTGG